VTAFLTAHLSAQRLTHVAVMSVKGGLTLAAEWDAFGGRVEAGRVLPDPVPAFLPESTVDIVQFTPGGGTALQPAPRGANTAPLFTPAAATDPALQQLAFTVEQPVSTHVINTDCFSCHTSTPRILTLRIASTGKRFRPARGITGYAAKSDLTNGAWSIRNFGYEGGAPSLSLRTVNETAKVAEFVNANLLHKRNPGKDCGADDSAVWTCFVAGGADCLAGCQ
jgi:hypothetical protein